MRSGLGMVWGGRGSRVRERGWVGGYPVYNWSMYTDLLIIPVYNYFLNYNIYLFIFS
jgi:hypothetical protein